MLIDVVERYVQCARYVAGGKLFAGAHIDDGYEVILVAPQEFAPGYSLQAVAVVEVPDDGVVHLVDMPLAGTPQTAKEIDDIIIGHTVEDVEPIFSRSDQACASKLLQVPGSVGDGEACHVCECFDIALTLREELQQFQFVRVA